MLSRIRQFILTLESWKVNSYWLGGMLFICGMLVRLWWVEARDLCIDEPFSVYHAQKSPLEIIRFCIETEPNPPLHFLFLHFFQQLLGIDVWAVRLFSVICSSLTGIVLFDLVKRYSNLTGALVAWLLFMFSTTFNLYDAEARAYSLFRLEFVLILWAFVELSQQPNRQSRWWILMLTATAMLYTHYLGTIVLAAMGALGLLIGPTDRLRRQLVSAFTVAAILFLPQFIASWEVILHRGGGDDARLWGWEMFKYLLVDVLNSRALFDRIMPFYLVALPFVLLAHFRSRRELWLVVLSGPVLYTLFYFGSQYVQFFKPGYMLFAFLPVIIGLGIAVGNSIKQFPLVLIPLTLFFLAAYLKAYEPLPKNILYREVENSVQAVQKLRQNNEAVFIYPPWTDLPYTYYNNIALFHLNDDDFYAALQTDKTYRILKSADITPEKHQGGAFILYLDEFTGTNPIGQLPDGYAVRDSIFVPDTYLILYCEPK